MTRDEAVQEGLLYGAGAVLVLLGTLGAVLFLSTKTLAILALVLVQVLVALVCWPPDAAEADEAEASKWR